VKTAKYHKRCFDQIQGINEDNKELTTEVDRLRKWLKTTERNQVELESQRLNDVLQLS
jgi:regulator of replication initiation timing